jgi:1,4-alpha-glucan branching enzyme
MHKGVQNLVRDLNAAYRRTPALHERDCESDGFQWLVCDDRDNSVIAFARFDRKRESVCIVVCNFTPVVRHDYTIGAPRPGFWAEIVNTDASFYGGGDVGNAGGLKAINEPSHGQNQSLRLTLPPLATLILEWRKD